MKRSRQRRICYARSAPSAEFVAAENRLQPRFAPSSVVPIPRRKFTGVYNGIDLERFSGAPFGQQSRPADRGASAAWFHSKVFDDLIDACDELSRRRIDFVCDIIGDGSAARGRFQAKIEQLDLSSRVNLLGSLSQDAVFGKNFRPADIFRVGLQLPTQQGATDVFPTVILEAMASARPVVSTRLAGIPELVVDGQDRNVSSARRFYCGLLTHLNSLLRDPELRLRFGHSGRASDRAGFSELEQTVAPLINLFQKNSAKPVKSNQSHASHSEAAIEIAYLIDRWA